MASSASEPMTTSAPPTHLTYTRFGKLSNLVRSHSFTAAVKRMVPRVHRAEESADDLSVDAPQSFSAEGPRARAREGLSVDATHAPGDPRSVQQAWLEQAEMREPPVAIGVDELRTLIAVSKEAAEYRKCAHDLQQALAASQAALHERELELSAARANRRRSEEKADAIASAQAAASAAIAAAAHAHRLEMQRFRQDMLAAVTEAQSTWASTWQREKEWAEAFLGESMRRTLRETMQEYRVQGSPCRESASLVLLPPSSSSCTGVAAVPIVEEAELQRGPSVAECRHSLEKSVDMPPSPPPPPPPRRSRAASGRSSPTTTPTTPCSPSTTPTSPGAPSTMCSAPASLPEHSPSRVEAAVLARAAPAPSTAPAKIAPLAEVAALWPRPWAFFAAHSEDAAAATAPARISARATIEHLLAARAPEPPQPKVAPFVVRASPTVGTASQVATPERTAALHVALFDEIRARHGRASSGVDSCRTSCRNIERRSDEACAHVGGRQLHGHGQLAMDLAAAIAKRRFLIGHHGQDESSDEEEGWVPERERERGRGKREPGEGEGHRRRPVSPPDNAASHGTSEPSRDSAGLASSPGDGTAALSETVPVEADVVLRSAAPLTAPLNVGAPSAILRLGALPSRAPPPSGRRGRTAVGALHKPSVRDCLNERSHLQKTPHGLPDGLNKNSPKMGDESEPNWGECLNVPSPEALSPQSTISMLDGPSHSFGLIATRSPFLARVLRSPEAERRRSATNSSAAAERVSIVWPSLRSAWRSAQAMAAGRRRFGLRKSAILVVIAAMLVALSPIAMLKAERRPGFADTELWPQMRLAPLPKLPSGWALTDLPAGFGFFPTSTPCKPSPQPRRRAVHGRALRSWWGVPALV